MQGHDALFVTELKKYEALSSDVERNLSAQTEILACVDRDNKVGTERLAGRAALNGSPREHAPQAFRAAFDIPGWRAACDKAASGLRGEVKAFKELLDHCSEVRGPVGRLSLPRSDAHGPY
jgi:programmed cell death 6-interacting protein